MRPLHIICAAGVITSWPFLFAGDIVPQRLVYTLVAISFVGFLVTREVMIRGRELVTDLDRVVRWGRVLRGWGGTVLLITVLLLLLLDYVLWDWLYVLSPVSLLLLPAAMVLIVIGIGLETWALARLKKTMRS